MLILVLTTAGCASGNANDARNAEERAATEGARVPGYEATKTVKQFFPTPGPTALPPTPMPAIATLQLTNQVGGDGAPIGSITFVSAGTTVYAAAQLSHLQRGEQVRALWRNAAGQQVGESTVAVDRAVDTAWFSPSWNVPPGTPFGEYAVYVYVGDQLLNSLVFQIG